MRIACVDKSAAERVSLQRSIERAYEENRATLGHVRPALAYPASKEELLIGSRPDAVAIGSSWELERSYSLAKEVREVFPGIPILVFLSEESFSLRSLRRFEKITSHVLADSDDSVRIVHCILRIQDESRDETTGELICVSGVKGGVGATSVVSGLAHGFQSVGKSSVVLDLSASSVFSIYMGCQKTTSSEYASVLSDGRLPDVGLIEKCIAEAPNGIQFVATPSGGTEMRELWLREPSRVELTLSIVDMLREQFDVVLVDIAHAEGLLPFALSCRSNARVLVSSNDPASVHLLSVELRKLFDAPGDGEIKIVFNALSDKGLTCNDVRNFIAQTYHFERSEVDISELPFDSTAKNWIGTGNTFFTEAKRSQQKVLEQLCAELLNEKSELEVADPSLLGGLKRFIASAFLEARPQVKRLPHLQSSTEKKKPIVLENKPSLVSEVETVSEHSALSKEDTAKDLNEEGNIVPFATNRNRSAERTGAVQPSSEFVYQPPKANYND